MPARPVTGTTHTGHSHSRLDHASALANRNATNGPVPGAVRAWRPGGARMRPDGRHRLEEGDATPDLDDLAELGTLLAGLSEAAMAVNSEMLAKARLGAKSD